MADSPNVERSQPLVGITGTANALEVIVTEQGRMCRLTRGVYRHLLGGSFLAGPGLAAVLWWQRNELAQHPPVIRYAAGLLCAVFFFVFLYYTFKDPRLEISSTRRTLTFRSWRSGPPAWTLAASDLRSFAISSRDFLEEGVRFPNFVLSVLTAQGNSIPLCVSTDRERIVSLKEDLERWAGFGPKSGETK